MSSNILFWCETCNKKHIVESLEDIAYIKRTKIIKNLPYFDDESKKTKKVSFLPEKLIYKCKVCGMLMKEIKNDESKQSS